MPDVKAAYLLTYLRSLLRRVDRLYRPNNPKMEVISVLLSFKLQAMIVLFGELSDNVIVLESDIFMDSHQRKAIQTVLLHCLAQICLQQTKRAK